jgi:hypothetical protein
MAIRTNMGSLTPRRQAFSKEITLPSGGYTNPKAFPGGKITVFPWDSSVDDMLLQQSRKKQNVDTLFQLASQVSDVRMADVDDLGVNEVPLILLVARALDVSSGNGLVAYNSACPTCGAEEHTQIQIPDQLEVLGAKPENYAGLDLVTLPVCQDVIGIRPLMVKDERTVLQRERDAKDKISNRELRTALAIVHVNETTPDSLMEMVQYLRALAPADIRFLEKEINDVAPRLNTLQEHKCDSCGRDYTVPLHFDTEFFRP